MRNDMPCGSTIGPILAHNLGCRTVDVGMPQLSMHSIREMAGVDDVLYGYKHFLQFFRWVAHRHTPNCSTHLSTLYTPGVTQRSAMTPCEVH